MSQTNLLFRDDTMLGVCQALGEDFRFHPNWLRAGLAVMFLWSPPAALAAYAGAIPFVLVSRWLAPNPRPAPAVEAETVEAEAEPLPIAA